MEIYNFRDRTLGVTKQINDRCGSVKNWRFSVSKTKSSIRILKMPQVLTNDLKMVKSKAEKSPGFNDNYFMGRNLFPTYSNTLTHYKNMNCKLDNVKQIRLHDFKHSCESILVNKGANVQVVVKYLGHTKFEETLKSYSRLFTNTSDEVFDVIINLNNNKTDDI